MTMSADPRPSGAITLSPEDCELICTARREGVVSAKLFDHGDFSEEGFLLFGRLEVLCLKGWMRFVDRIGKNDRTPGDVRMVFALADGVPA